MAAVFPHATLLSDCLLLVALWLHKPDVPLVNERQRLIGGPFFTRRLRHPRGQKDAALQAFHSPVKSHQNIHIRIKNRDMARGTQLADGQRLIGVGS